jgi:hypothetical protein
VPAPADPVGASSRDSGGVGGSLSVPAGMAVD